MDVDGLLRRATTTGPLVTTPHAYKSPVPFWGTIIIAGAACLFLLSLFTCLIICVCRRRNKRKKVPKRGLPVTDPFDKFNPNKSLVQPDLDEELPVKNLGIIHYSLDYNLRERKLYVGVVKIDNLPSSVLSKPSQPYVTVRLHPDLHIFQTKHVNFTHNPVFNESFVFPMPPEKQTVSTLIFTVYDFQMFSKHKKLSQLHLPLKSTMLSSVVEECAALHEPLHMQETTELGDVCVSLKYVPSHSKLTVVVIEAKNLLKHNDDFRDPYVKLYLRLNNKRIKKKKTTTIAATGNNPYYNESFDFNVTPIQIKDASLLVRVAFKTSLGRIKNLGEVLLGFSEFGGTSNGHWTSIVNSPGQPFALWHSLVLCNE